MITEHTLTNGQMDHIRRRALTAGAIGAIACVIGLFVNSGQFYRSYLMAYLFWLGIGLGCLPLLMLHHLVGGLWGFVIRRILESGTRTLLITALLFVPILFGMHDLYEWTHADAVASDHALEHKKAYLNIPFFVARALVYFGLWLTFAFFLNRWSAEQDRTGDPASVRRFQLLSAPGILVYVLAMTFASFDWAMSIEPHWFSTIYGMLFVTGQVLSTLAFVIPVAAFLADNTSVREIFGNDVFQDLGNLLLAFIMLWAYMSFSQYLIIWAGNLPEEITWYMHRGRNGWQWVAAALALFHFAIPFLILLARQNKRKRRVIATLALAVLAMRFVDMYWLIAPAFRPAVAIHWLDFAAWMGVGGVWIAGFVTQLSRRSLLPLRDPNFQIEKAA
jgi:hypothetical protein